MPDFKSFNAVSLNKFPSYFFSLSCFQFLEGVSLGAFKIYLEGAL